MANYHCSARTGKHASSKQQYNEREGKYANQDDKCVFSMSENLPDFANGSSEQFWKACDKNERANANKYREIEASLPVELPRAKQKKLAIEFARIVSEAYGTEAGNLPYTLAIHQGKGTNPHVHIQFCERGNNSEMSAEDFFSRKNPKNKELGGSRRKDALNLIREEWANLQNKYLAQNGSRERVSHLSYEAQGIDRKPQIKEGPGFVHELKKEYNEQIRTERYLEQYQRSQSKDVRDLQTVANELRPKHKPSKPKPVPKAQKNAIKSVFADAEDNAYKNMRNAQSKLQMLQKDFQPGLFTLIANLFGIQTQQQAQIAEAQRQLEQAQNAHKEAKQQKQLVASVMAKTPVSELAQELRKIVSAEQMKDVTSAASQAKSQHKDLTKDFQREVEKYNRDNAIAKVAQQQADDVQRLLKQHEEREESIKQREHSQSQERSSFSHSPAMA